MCSESRMMREQRASLLLHPLLFCFNIKTRIQNVSALRARCSALQTRPLVHASDGSLWLSRTIVRRQHQPITAGQTDARLAGSEGLNEDLGGSRAVLVGPCGRLHQRFQCCFKPGTTGAAERSSANKSNNLINTNGMFNDIFPFQRNSRGVFSTRESSRQTKTRLQDPGSWIPPLPSPPLPSPPGT